MTTTAWTRSQEVSLQSAGNWGKGWTVEELTFLAEFPEVPTAELAEAMGRTVYSICTIRQLLEQGKPVGSSRKPRKAEVGYDFVDTFPPGWWD